MEDSGALFDKKDLQRLIIPLVLEQILSITIGMTATIMVASAGDAAVSGVSLVDTITILLINVFSALATGGAVVSAQYLGKGEPGNACTAAKQLVISITALSLALMVLSLGLRDWLLRLIFNEVEPAVMSSAQNFFVWTALSFPFLALYNVGAALFRAMGNSKISLQTALVMNIVNVVGNAITIYGLKMGVTGAGLVILITRIVGAVIMLILIRNRSNPIYVDDYIHLKPKMDMIKRIMAIGIPNGLENGMFQFGKILVQGLTASFGTAAIAANAVGNSISSMAVIPGSAMGLALITIVGRCVGAQEYDMARHYIAKLMKLVYLSMAVLNVAIMVGCRAIIGIYHLSPEASEGAYQIMMLYCAFAMVFWPASFTLPNALRAAGDARFTMIVSIFSMWIFRVIFSYILGRDLHLGLVGVWLAMFLDWIFRGAIFVIRIRGNRWTGKRVV